MAEVRLQVHIPEQSSSSVRVHGGLSSVGAMVADWVGCDTHIHVRLTLGFSSAFAVDGTLLSQALVAISIIVQRHFVQRWGRDAQRNRM